MIIEWLSQLSAHKAIETLKEKAFKEINSGPRVQMPILRIFLSKFHI